MTSTNALAEAARSGVHAMIASLGATTVQLQMRESAEATSLTPVAIRRSADAVRLLVPAGVLETTLGVQGNAAITESMQSIAQILVGDEAFVFSGTEELEIAGGVCLYRLVLQEVEAP